jgi:predicted acylesterase/phospholipase RssA
MIYTLYSFKGGVGRSMALANVAECFFQKDLRVVMIDWDLEAPGLENYFFSPAVVDGSTESDLAGASSRRGLIDMLLEYKAKFPEIARRRRIGAVQPHPMDSPLSQAMGESTDREKRTREIAAVAEITKQFLAGLAEVPESLRQLPNDDITTRISGSVAELIEETVTPIEQYLQPIHRSGQTELLLLSAGVRTPEGFGRYAEAVQDFDWVEFLAAYEGREYLEWLRRKLNAIADVVLIDSRTGVTEMGGVCTRQMADAVISFCAPNFQNLAGVVTVASSFDTESAKKARYDRDLQLLIIPTRIDDFESGLLDQFSKDFGQKMETESFIPHILKDTDRPFWNLQIPYIPKFNYREQRVIGPGATTPDPATTKLIKAYNNIAVHLALLAPGTSKLRLAFASEIGDIFPYLDRSKVPRISPLGPGNWVERDEDLASLKAALLECANQPGGGRLAVWGEAGVGKTSLVARACQDEQILQAYPDGIVWLTLDRPWDDEQIQNWLRSNFALPPKGGPQALVAALENRRFLFVVDDVWNLDEIDRVFRFGQFDTRVIVTRDLAVASAFASRVVTVRRFGAMQFKRLLKDPPAFVTDSGDSTLDALLRWPLGASLMRAAYERQAALKENPEEVWNDLLKAFQSQGIATFDQPGVSDRRNSAVYSIRESIGRLRPEERRLLSSIARRQEEGFWDPREPSDRVSSLRGRLSDLGLIVDSHGKTVVPPLIRAWLASQGDIDTGRKSKEGNREQTIRSGYQIIRGRSAGLEEIQKLAEEAKNLRSFSLARRLFTLARQQPEAALLTPSMQLKLLQRQVLCTYKDDDLPTEERFPQALELLRQGDLSGHDPSQESLGLAGAIYKGFWRITGSRSHLERSLAFYLEGARQQLVGDYGYTRINSAFVLDLLATLEEQGSPEVAKARRKQAQDFREEILANLPDLASQRAHTYLKQMWWYGATLAEACFGLGKHADARYWLREALALEPADWELESTARQMVALARAQGLGINEDSPEWRTLALLVGDSMAVIRAIMAGKTGLAMSGGGFRAALFHIGVLARLAELDVLRHIEVLSCVSGGSIVGAHYYLEVRALLKDKPDHEITCDDYITIVKNIERDFLKGVQKNLRTRLFAGWLANLRSIVQPGYTRTNYLGQLFERHLYAKPLGQDGPIWINDLKIKPAQEDEDFNPKLDNWRRAAKVPILLLNATTLNTGHNWQFAVSWMGEPPLGASGDVDRNDLLRRMYYTEAPLKHRHVRLGEAVAASACVPGLFDPFELRLLYPRRTVRLVDGGVHDNQGIAGLLEQECAIALVSDASGQMNSEQTPSGEAYSVPFRSNSILMSRVREAEFRELRTLQRSSSVSGLMFLHLKKDLDVNNVDWIDCQDPYHPLIAEKGQGKATLTSFGVPKSAQERLAGLRTDLDSFSDAEAYALMLSGYRMTETEFARCVPMLDNKQAKRGTWQFLNIRPALDRETDHDADHEKLLNLLKVGAKRGFKAWRTWAAVTRILVQAIPLMVLLVAVGLIAMTVASSWIGRADIYARALELLLEIFTNSRWVGGMLAVLTTCIAVYVTTLLARRPKSLTTILTGALMVTVGWILARLHLWIVEPAYLRAGAGLGIQESPAPRRASFAVRSAVLCAFAAGSVWFYLKLLPPITDQIEFRRYAALAQSAVVAQDFNSAASYWEEDAYYIDTSSINKSDRLGALSGLAYANLRLGHWSNALDAYDSIGPSDLTLNDLQGKAWALRESGHPEEAVAIYQQILKRNPGDSRTAADLSYSEDLAKRRVRDGDKISGSIQPYVAVAQQSAIIAGLLKRLFESLGLQVLPDKVEEAYDVPSETQLRYFFDEDKNAAEKIITALNTKGISAALIKSDSYLRRTDHINFELRFSPQQAVGGSNSKGE